MNHYWPLSSNKLSSSGQGQDLGFGNDTLAQSNTKNQSHVTWIWKASRPSKHFDQGHVWPASWIDAFLISNLFVRKKNVSVAQPSSVELRDDQSKMQK